MPRYHGKSGQVLVSTTGSGTASGVIGLSKWSLDMATDKVEVTAFADTNKVYVQGLKDVKGSLSGFWESSEDPLFDAADSADGCKLYLYPSSAAPTVYWAGPAWMDVSIDVDSRGAVSISGNFVAAGAWVRKP